MRPLYCFISVLFISHTTLVIGSEYAGQEARSIKSLSQSDIEQIEQGRGWGLAKPAELNGLPGPIHLLELREELALSNKQINAIETLFTEMNSKAKQVGKQYIDREKAIESLLVQPTLSESKLASLVYAANQTLAELRLTHLRAHLATPDLLTDTQLEQYQALRGYNYGDPCKNPPSGHDINMWKQHNNCP